MENLPFFAKKERQSLPVVNHNLIVFNTYAVFLDWKNGAELEKMKADLQRQQKDAPSILTCLLVDVESFSLHVLEP